MNLVSQIESFITSIGLHIHHEPIEGQTFLPGIFIRKGDLVVDKEKLLYPGDLLHEAGHLAVMPPRIRQQMNGDLDFDPIHEGGELAALAWSYAAAVHLGIDPHIVFHEHGYKGAGMSLVENFQQGADIGVPLLVWCGMTMPSNTGNDEHAFPKMLEWLCSIDKYQETAT